MSGSSSLGDAEVTLRVALHVEDPRSRRRHVREPRLVEARRGLEHRDVLRDHAGAAHVGRHVASTGYVRGASAEGAGRR